MHTSSGANMSQFDFLGHDELTICRLGDRCFSVDFLLSFVQELLIFADLRCHRTTFGEFGDGALAGNTAIGTERDDEVSYGASQGDVVGLIFISVN